jgi:hypothetical protein
MANDAADLFRHVSAEKAEVYRCIMDVFAAAKRQYRLQLRPDEVLAEAEWPKGPPRIEEVNAVLNQLTGWGNLVSHLDTARVSTIATSIAPASSIGCLTAERRWDRHWLSLYGRCNGKANCKRWRSKT